MTRVPVALLTVALVLGAGSTTGSAQGAFPWGPSDVPVLAGVRLGDSRARVDSVLGAPTSTRPLDSGLLLCRYEGRAVVVAFTPSGDADVIYADGATAALGEVRMGASFADVRARWGEPSEAENDVRFYAAGREWLVSVRLDATNRVAQLGLIRVDPVPAPYVVPDSLDVFRVAAGTWDWKSASGFCRADPHTITFSEDHKFMILRSTRPGKEQTAPRETRYEIRGHTRSSIRGFIEDETRRTEAGALVVWDLVLMSPDVYRWHRTDWQEGAYTGEILRCPSP